MLAYFQAGDLQGLVNAVAGAQVPAGSPIYAGSYGPNAAAAGSINALPDGRYAPMFSIQPATSRVAYRGRRLPADQAGPLDSAYAGEIPREAPSVPLAARDRRRWGRELGCRFRDSIRQARTAGVDVETWQFDELLREVAAGSSAEQRAYRDYTTGILEGLLTGRPELGDEPEQGIVWTAAWSLRRLPTLSIGSTPGLEEFWQALNNAALLYVGQEYAPFRGPPEAAARDWSTGQRLLLREGVVRPQLGRKYVVGMTPGFHSRFDILQGNVDGKPQAWVNSWRTRYVRARVAAARVAGFGQFNFCEDNCTPERMLGAVRAAAAGIQASRGG